MKICNKCRVEKAASEFYIRDGKLITHCKKCCNNRVKIWKRDHKEKHAAATAAWIENHKEDHLARARKRSNRYNRANPEKVKERKFRYRQSSKEKIQAYQKQWAAANLKERAAYRRRLVSANPGYAISLRVRTLIADAVRERGTKKSARSETLLNCSMEIFNQRLEKLFWPGMSWKNRHKWHLDHIRPCADFDLTDPEQQKQCFHFSNWQPLWADDNGIKSDRLDWTPHESRHSLPERLKPAPFIFP